ncbi:MAG TPA: MoaD/ThiS family protein [Chloroflexota bacterium]|nr:MoaD/ThiS family protein [Chloroflexota bacterium]
MVTIRVEVMPWLSKTVGQKGWGKVIWTREMPPGATLRDLISTITVDHADFGEAVWHPIGDHIREEATVLVNGKLSDLRHGADTQLSDGDLVIFLPSYSGGAVALEASDWRD